MQKNFFIYLFAVLLMASCSTAKKIAETPEPAIEIDATEFRDLDTMVVSAAKPVELKKAEDYQLPAYAPTYTLKNDLVHTRLDLSFDWAKQQVIGKAELVLKPFFYPTNHLQLDAKGFDILKVMQPTGKELKYDYDGKVITIQLDREYKKTENYKVIVKYIAKPTEGEIGGSAAITSEQGLFFVNHDGKDKNTPMQIWTQGETEWNSRWFPTIDHPNERCTQEMYLTVQDRFETLSNGTLVSSNKNADGTRTDYWKMDLPHAPYLFMIAVGEFAIVKDTWEGIPVDYYVEEEYKPYARQIFEHTPEMLTFFSDMLGVKYPWPKYAQIIVREYVSGAMENTTGVIFGDFVQKTDRELIDDDNDYIVAHELFHHWFGDYVTCESWANLTMNEGFANYSEYLWFEHKDGRDRADHHRINELNGYLGSVMGGGEHPLIWFETPDSEAMFDAHSYNKGGLVLHMLRNYVGDEAFFASLNKYLVDNAYTAVEAHDLRLAFEEVTGQDLNWFFNQWYFAAGHPQLTIDYGFDAVTKKASVTIEQTQDPDKFPAIFQLPIAIDIYESAGKPTRQQVMMTQRKQTFTFDVNAKPALINVDADKVLLAERTDNKTEAEYVFQYYNAPNLMDRFEAVQNLQESKSAEAKKVKRAALKDNFWFIRNLSIGMIEPDDSVFENMATLAKNDPHSNVRESALTYLVAAEAPQIKEVTTAILAKEKAYPVIGSALMALQQTDPAAASEMAAKFEKDSDNASILAAVGAVYALQGDAKKLSFFENNWHRIDGPPVMDFFGGYGYLLQSSGTDITPSLKKLHGLSTDMSQSLWRRFASTKTMSDLKQVMQQSLGQMTNEQVISEMKTTIASIENYIKEIKEKETDSQLKGLYDNF